METVTNCQECPHYKLDYPWDDIDDDGDVITRWDSIYCDIFGGRSAWHPLGDKDNPIPDDCPIPSKIYAEFEDEQVLSKYLDWYAR